MVKKCSGSPLGRAISLLLFQQIPNFGKPGRGPVLKPGMTLAIEPMVNMGGSEVGVEPDGWSVLTRDRMPSAHFEHTVAVGNGKAEILTA